MMLMLGPVDVLVLLKLIAKGDEPWTQMQIASELSLSQSIVNRSLKNAEGLGLYWPKKKRVNSRMLAEALIHGARFFLAPSVGSEVRGIGTAWVVQPLSNELASADAMPPVWKDPMGDRRGKEVQPLHPNVPAAVRADSRLYELLALLDALRIGGSRERAIASRLLKTRLEGGWN